MKARRLVFLGLVLLGCGTKVASVTQAIGADGGTVSNSAGVAIDIPPGALTSGTDIAIEPASPASLTGFSAVGATYAFGPEGTSFDAPVTVTLPFSSADLPAGSTSADVRILTAAQGSTDFVSLGAVTISGSHIQGQTTHFSVFVPAVAVEGAPADAGTDGGIPDAGSTCGSANCSGCCLTDGGCQTPGTLFNACGYGGAACVNCGALVPAKQCYGQPYPYCH